MLGSRALLTTALAALALVGCSRDEALTCEPTERYATARSAQPVQIPDDLSPPDESDALRLPPDVGQNRAPTRPCLESPPSFFGDAPAAESPAGTSDETPSSETPESAGERVIEN